MFARLNYPTQTSPLIAEAELQPFKDSMRARLMEPPRSLADAASRAWAPIVNRTYAFSKCVAVKKEKEKKHLRNLALRITLSHLSAAQVMKCRQKEERIEKEKK